MREYNKLTKEEEQDKHVKNVNEARKFYEMKLLEPKKRECLRCDVSFTSYQFSNRMCANCRTYSIGE